MESVWTAVTGALGLDRETLTVGQMALRALVVYVVGLVLVRLGQKRFIGQLSAFDVIMGIMVGSILSRAITTPRGFFAILGAALILVVLHYLTAVLSYHSDWLGDVVKGTSRTLVVDGEIKWDGMRGGHISKKDLQGALRENAGIEEVARVKRATLERTGSISVVLADDEDHHA